MPIGLTGVLTRTPSDDLLLNSDNLTADTEDSSLSFSRGTLDPNAILRWDSTDDVFKFNFPVDILGNVIDQDTVFLDIDTINAIFDGLTDAIAKVDDSFEWEVPLLGTKDGVNTIFTSPFKFLSTHIAVYINGQRVTRNVDFTIAESVLTEGFDTVIFTEAPESFETLFTDLKKP